MWKLHWSVLLLVSRMEVSVYIVTDANPKAEPSSPRATRVNCCAASRVRLDWRVLCDSQDMSDSRKKGP